MIEATRALDQIVKKHGSEFSQAERNMFRWGFEKGFAEKEKHYLAILNRLREVYCVDFNEHEIRNGKRD